jgi:hypothetical protein
MRTVLIGSDFVYDKSGNLTPIEINTAVGWDLLKVESDDVALDTTQIKEFAQTNGFTKIIYIGSVYPISDAFSKMSTELGAEYVFEKVPNDSITVPQIEDNDTTLIIRSAYDTTALVDDTYCKNKINFLNLIKDQSFGSQFAYMDSLGTLVNNITSIPDNGNHPNFILKCVYPNYDKNDYPKLYRVTSQEELNTVLGNVDKDYFLMEFHINESKLSSGNLMVYRNLSILYPPSLLNIPFGAYTRITQANLNDTNVYDPTTFVLNDRDKLKYLTSDAMFLTPKLADGDLVEMEDGTFKTAEDLQIGDIVKTIDIPNPTNANIIEENVDFKINYDDFLAQTTYSSNRITDKKRINRLIDKIKITFTDGTSWYDTRNSHYLGIKNGDVRFLTMSLLSKPNDTFVEPGCQIILIDTSSEELKIETKEVATVEVQKEMFNGWSLTVEREHLFLTKSDLNTGNTSYVAIEHNFLSCYTSFTTCFNYPPCGKGATCCGASGQCKTYCFQCPAA